MIGSILGPAAVAFLLFGTPIGDPLNGIISLVAILTTGLVFGLVVSGGLGWYDAQLRSLLDLGPYLHGLAYVMGLSVALSLASLPFGIYSQFWLEERFGFNRTTLASMRSKPRTM